MKFNSEIFPYLVGIISIITFTLSMWDRSKLNSVTLTSYLDDNKNLVIKNLGKKEIKVINIEINKHPIEKYSITKKNYPFKLQSNGVVIFKIINTKKTPIPEECSIKVKGLFFQSLKTFSI